MTNPNDPAFVGIMDNTFQYVPGMTKREYFAAMAMSGMELGEISPNRAAEWAVAFSDALIWELNQDGK